MEHAKPSLQPEVREECNPNQNFLWLLEDVNYGFRVNVQVYIWIATVEGRGS